jgi:hypothetical protein
MTALLQGKPVRMAVLSSASAVRFVVSMFALMNRDFKAYSPSEAEAAFTHLGLTAAERFGLPRVIERLREKLEPPEPLTARRRRSDLQPPNGRSPTR